MGPVREPHQWHPTNTNANSNDTLLSVARVDYKPLPGLLLGASGSYGQLTLNHLERSLYGARVIFDGTETLPLWVRAEHMAGADEQADGSEIEADGHYVSVPRRYRDTTTPSGTTASPARTTDRPTAA